MQARDVMTKRVLSVTPDTNVRQAATFLVEHGISAAPVLDAKGVLVGLVSEGDLFRRAETGTAKRRSWWLSLLSSNEIEAREFTKANALQVKDLMTRGVVTVGEETEIGEIADLLERKQIKRVPVVKDGRGTAGLAIPKTNWANTIDTPPFQAYAVTCGVTFTFGGVKIAPDTNVQNVGGRNIPGLYAAGEMIGGLFYFNYPSGSGLVSGAVFGRLAGTSAARYARQSVAEH